MLYRGFYIKPVYLEGAFDKKGKKLRSHFEVKHAHSHTRLGNFKKMTQAKKDVDDFYTYYENLQRS